MYKQPFIILITPHHENGEQYIVHSMYLDEWTRSQHGKVDKNIIAGGWNASVQLPAIDDTPKSVTELRRILPFPSVHPTQDAARERRIYTWKPGAALRLPVRRHAPEQTSPP